MTASNPHGLTVGQTLWFAHHAESRWHLNYEDAIAKIGSKYATFVGGTYRVSLATLSVDSGDQESVGRCYFTRADWENYVAMKQTWRYMVKTFDAWHPPPGMTMDKIEAIRKLVGVE